jgi:hypothetical protein
MPDHEPKGYWDMLRHVGPKPLIEREKLKSETDWVEAGRRVFDEATTPQLTTFDPRFISRMRDRDYLENMQAAP